MSFDTYMLSKTGIVHNMEFYASVHAWFFVCETEYEMAHSSDARVIAYCMTCFMVGFICGYQAGNLRRKWLQTKRNFFQRKLDETKKRLDAV